MASLRLIQAELKNMAEVIMGTKNNPGSFDCYANAEPDEPMFVLLGRDKNAPSLVDLWARQREVNEEDPVKVQEARDCANAMRVYAGIECPVQAARLQRLCFELDVEMDGVQVPKSAASILNAIREVLGKF